MSSSFDKSISPSRTYVAQCNKSDFAGFYFKKFTLPSEYDNNSDVASWYFLNQLNSFACIEGSMSFEDYSNIKDQI